MIQCTCLYVYLHESDVVNDKMPLYLCSHTGENPSQQEVDAFLYTHELSHSCCKHYLFVVLVRHQINCSLWAYSSYVFWPLYEQEQDNFQTCIPHEWKKHRKEFLKTLTALASSCTYSKEFSLFYIKIQKWCHLKYQNLVRFGFHNLPKLFYSQRHWFMNMCSL